MNKTTLPSYEDLMKFIMLKNDSIWDHCQNLFTINNWLQNFNGSVLGDEDYERHLALWLLSNFVFYNQKEVRHLCTDLYNQYIHYILSYNSSYYTGDAKCDLRNLINATRFLPLGNPGESGSFILYFFRQQNDLPSAFFSVKTLTDDSVKHIAVVDDVTLSGTQAVDYLKPLVHSTDKEIFLLTFFSTEKAKKYVLDELGVKVISCLTLDERCRCFTNTSIMFHDFGEERENCEKMAFGYGRKIFPEHPLGYDQGQYAFGFFYNTPDNTLPIFWSDKNGWIPIFNRYHKKYSKGAYAFDFGTFV